MKVFICHSHTTYFVFIKHGYAENDTRIIFVKDFTTAFQRHCVRNLKFHRCFLFIELHIYRR